MNAEAFRKYAADNSDSAEVKELFARGQKAGSASGQAQAKSDLQAMTEAFPDDPAYVLKCYAKGRTVDEARELKAEIDTATATANAAMTAAKAEAEQAKAKLGEQGAINLRASATADIDADDTKAVAAAEWDANPEVRKGFRNKDNYVFARAAELDGSHKSFSREPMKV